MINKRGEVLASASIVASTTTASVCFMVVEDQYLQSAMDSLAPTGGWRNHSESARFMQTACHRWQTILIVVNIEQWLLKYESTPYKTMLNLECGVLGGRSSCQPAAAAPASCADNKKLCSAAGCIRMGWVNLVGLMK
ncbi:hypothetical protein HOE425_331047 [Hoeflea sp. EC-HK425]|nr:hypothetical protein HOE425_331047 [Hoeflea sp. EC-HK425]